MLRILFFWGAGWVGYFFLPTQPSYFELSDTYFLEGRHEFARPEDNEITNVVAELEQHARGQDHKNGSN